MEFKEWQTVSLTELYSISSGLSKKRSDFGFGNPFLTFKEVFHNIFLPDELNELANTTEKEQVKCSIQRGDVFLTRTSEKFEELGLSSVSLKDYSHATFNGFTKRLRPNNKAHDELMPEYAAFYFRTNLFRNQMESLTTMSTRASLNNEMISKLSITYPSLSKQKSIVDILLSIHEKINVNNQVISSLEQLAQTLFKRWFVDFEFPNENGDPYKSSGGEMVESELGMIPAQFKVRFLSQSVDFLSGGTPKTKIGEYWNGEIPFFTPKDAIGPIYVTQTEKSITELGLSKCNSKLYPKNTIFITARGTVGKLSMANTEMAVNQSCFALKHKGDSQYFLYFMTETLLRQIIQGSNGAVFNAINLRDLNTLKVVYPKEKLIFQFERMMEPIFEMISEKEYESINLVTLHNVLLPKLMSGEIDLGSESEVTV